MADAAPGEGMSKSAKRRAAKKARDAAHEEEEAPPPPAPEPKAKAKGKAKAEPAPPPAAEPKAKAKGKAKASPEPPAAPKAEAKAKAKGKAKAEPEPPAAAPKAKAKGAAKAEPAKAPEPAPKPAAKSNAKGKAKAAPKPEVEEAPKKESTDLPPNFVIDDGSGPAWEVSAGLSKKMQKRKERQEEEKAAQVAMARGSVGSAGLAPKNFVPGMGPAQASSKGDKAATSQAVAADVARILASGGKVVEEAPKPEGNVSTATVHVPESRIGIVIGPKGAKIKLIQEKTGVSRIDTSGDVFTITGPPNAVAEAERAVKELVEKGYCTLQYDDFSENYLNVHPSCFPDLIGKQGAVVRKIKDELNVEINFPETQKNAPGSKKYKVTLAGASNDVEKAKQVMNNIMMYSHDELTHPGQVHEELEIDNWAWRYIIGKAGSEMRHIQNNYKVKVIIPRENSLCDKVLVVGEVADVERAKVYIEKLIWNAENQQKGRDKVDNGDVWGDEEEEEDWMKSYIYKR